MKGARLALSVFVLMLAGLPAIGNAQTGRLKGKVVDAESKPVEGALLTISSKELNTKRTVKTDKRGEYTIFIPPGPYTVTAEKDKLSMTQDARVTLDDKELNFTLRPGGGAAGTVSDAERKKVEAENAAIKTAFADAVTLSNAGKIDEAVAKFDEVAAKVPKCVECYTNSGALYLKAKEYDKAEAAYKKAIDVNASSAEAYMGLSNTYNAQKKFDQAAEASAQAAKLGAAAPGGASASTVFNQGVIAWNASRIDDAKKAFEEAVKLDPKLAEAHYWLGMANLNQGKMPEAAQAFEAYLKLDAAGKYAEQAKGILAQIKK